MVLVLQLGGLDLLKLLRQSRHGDCGRRGGEGQKSVRGGCSGGDGENLREKKEGTAGSWRSYR